MEYTETRIKGKSFTLPFEELYRLLDFEYLVENSGSLAQFPAGSFQLVVVGGALLAQFAPTDSMPFIYFQF